MRSLVEMTALLDGCGGKITEIDPQTTKISVQIDYNFPGGFAGKALSKLFEPGVHAAVSASDHKLNSILKAL